MNYLLSVVSLIIVTLASGVLAYTTDVSYFESFVTTGLGFIILRNAQNDLKK